ncbi:hypothetical protein Tco_0919117 [Tanacetum coccineum]
MVYIHSATDVASHLVAYTRERKCGYSWPSTAESISKGNSPWPWHSQISQFGREAKSLYLLSRRAPVPLVVEGLLRRRKCVDLIHSIRRIYHIVLDERITEHVHEVRAIGCDSKLPPRGKPQSWGSKFTGCYELSLLESGVRHSYVNDHRMVPKDRPDLTRPKSLKSKLTFGGYTNGAIIRVAGGSSLKDQAWNKVSKSDHIDELQDKSIVEVKLSSKGSASVAGMRDCRSLPLEENAAPHLMRRLLLLTFRRDCCSLPPEKTAAPYFLRRLLLLVIASGLEVAFVTPAIPVDPFQHGVVLS